MTQLERPDTLTAAVAKHIRDAIVRGDFAPGSALPEIRLAEQLGTSRGTVREALRALEDQGLVDVLPHKGSFVSQVTRRNAAELYSLRMVLEAFAVRLAVERGAFTGGGRTALEQRMEALQSAVESGEPMDLVEAERALHREIWFRCDHQLLLDVLADLQIQTRRLLIFNRIFERRSLSDEIKTHAALVGAVLSGDPDRAEAAARDHIRRSSELVLAKMPADRPEG